MANEFDSFSKKMQAAMEELGKSSNMQKIGDFAADIIRKRTRLGYGVEKTGDERTALKPLDPEYKLFRAQTEERTSKKTGKALKARNVKSDKPLTGNFAAKLHKKNNSSKSKEKLNTALTSVNKSNLTYTGQMLDSLKATATKDSVVINVTGQRRDGQSNEDIAAENEDRGRRFNDLAKGDLNQLRVFLSTIVDDILKKLK